MDFLANARHGISAPSTYWSTTEWLQVFDEAGLTVRAWIRDLEIYAKPFDWLFGGSLHFLTDLIPEGANPSA